MHRRELLVRSIWGTVWVVAASQSAGCALVFDGAKTKTERSSDIQWGYFVADVLLTGLIGLVIDFATGAIYKPTGAGVALSTDPDPSEVARLLDRGGDRVRLCHEARVATRDRAGLDGLASALEAHVPHCPRCARALSRANERVALTAVVGAPVVLDRIVVLDLSAAG
ncbi:MAG: hypothetical protein ABMB14_23785 [Myxococcota bacterium]